MTDQKASAAIWVSPPGETIADILEERGLSQAQLAVRIGFTKKHVNALVKGTASIEPSTALKLEAVLGSTAQFWLTREARYREALARQQELEGLKAYLPWLSALPLAHMLKHGWVSKSPSKTEQLAECLRFFGVGSVDAWEATYGQALAAFRASSKGEARAAAVAAWLRQGERLASVVPCGPPDSSGLRGELARLRTLTLQPDPSVFVPEFTSACAKHGVAVVLVPAPRGCPVFGATRWLSSGKALLLLSLRGKANDHLWFTFFHEVAHILLHGKKLTFLEGNEVLEPKHEREANSFAEELLIPSRHKHRLSSMETSKEAVVAFAEEIGVAPGVVVGRLQREGRIGWSQLNELKLFYKWMEE